MSLSISNNLLFVFAIFIFFGKTKKLLLQQFGKALANFYQLAILTVSARKFARAQTTTHRARGRCCAKLVLLLCWFGAKADSSAELDGTKPTQCHQHVCSPAVPDSHQSPSNRL